EAAADFVVGRRDDGGKRDEFDDFAHVVASLGLGGGSRRGNQQAPQRAAAANVTGGALPDLTGPTTSLSRGALLFLKPELAGCLTAASRRFLAGKVTDAQVPRVNKETPAVDQDLRLTRGRLDHGRALEDRRHPDTPAVVHPGLEVGEDLVVFVHRDAVQAHPVAAGLRSALTA